MIIIGLVLATVVGWAGMRWANSKARPQHALGIIEGRLADCPDRPNCVSTTSARPEQSMAPIALIDPADETRATLKSIIRSMPRSRIISSDEKYLHAEFRSRLFGFVDDVELLIDEEAGVIHFRAAARVGYSDLGVNRKRMERLSQVMRRRAQLKRPKPLRGR